MANIQLAKNLLYLRTLYNLKQDDIANLFNITRQACSNYEKSTRTPDLDVLASFAAYFHVTLDQLILHDLKAEEELNLILAFRSSSDEQRKIVTGFLNSDK